MSDAPAEAGTESPPKPKSKATVTAAVAVVGLLAGAGAGYTMTPKLFPQVASADSASHAASGDDDAEAESEKGGHEKGGEAGKIIKLDNIIVNPAGSEGSRFLMASVAFEVGDEATQASLTAHEVEVRDLAISVLESQTMVALTKAGARENIKRELAGAVARILGPKKRVKVYLPQFVIQ